MDGSRLPTSQTFHPIHPSVVRAFELLGIGALDNIAPLFGHLCLQPQSHHWLSSHHLVYSNKDIRRLASRGMGMQLRLVLNRTPLTHSLRYIISRTYAPIGLGCSFCHSTVAPPALKEHSIPFRSLLSLLTLCPMIPPLSHRALSPLSTFSLFSSSDAMLRSPASQSLKFEDSDFLQPQGDSDSMIFGLDLDDSLPFDRAPAPLSSWETAYNDIQSPRSLINTANEPSPPLHSALLPQFDSHLNIGAYRDDVSPSSVETDDSDFYLWHWVNDRNVMAIAPTSSPIPFPTSEPTQPLFQSFPDRLQYPDTASLSPSQYGPSAPLSRLFSPSLFTDGLSSSFTALDSVSPCETSARPPPEWATKLWDDQGFQQVTSPPPLADHVTTTVVSPPSRRHRHHGHHHARSRDSPYLGQTFQSSSAPSLTQADHHHHTSALHSRAYRRRAESVDEDNDATVRRKKRGSAPEDRERSADLLPTKSLLRPPKLAPSAWQLYFTDWISHQQASSSRKLNVAQAAKEAGQEYATLTPEQKEPFKRRSQAAKEQRERELAEYMRTLTPEDIKRENIFRAAQRKAGKSRKSNIKDPNAPKKPLSAYFMFLQRIRSDPLLVQEVFGEETETTKQSVLAAAKWRSMTDEERKPFLAQAEQEKLNYEAARRIYERDNTSYGTSIHFSILPRSSGIPFPMSSLVRSEPPSSESDSEGFATDDGIDQQTRS